MRRSESRLISLISLISATALIGCSGGDDPDGGVVDTGTPPADTGVTEPDAGVVDTGVEDADAGEAPDAGGLECLVDDPGDLTADPTCTGEWVVTVRGVLQDQNGTGVDGARAQVCIRTPDDTLVCLNPKATCGGGEWETLVPELGNNVRCVENLVTRSFAFDRPFAETYCNFDVTGLGPRATLPAPVPLYEVTGVANLPPLGTTDMARTVTFTGDLEMDVVPDGFTDEFTREDYDKLGAVRLAGDVSPRPCFYGAGDDFDAMYGFTPTVNIAGDTGFPFRIANTGLAQGTSVDLYVLGGLDCRLEAGPESTVEEGHWEKYATVTAGADGVISGNLPCFNWFAYKAN